ncbi:protein argonaute-4-like isoform X2 [Scylla paramamosain]|uniref:protein argonaute-4-like isoform X2 n=1 Tax=Scylla paramamosain TaxID=85552 RepID=UPI0030833F31
MASPSCQDDADGGEGEGECVGAGLPLVEHLKAWLLPSSQPLSRPLRPRQRSTLMAQLESAGLVRIISLPNMKGANLYQASPSPPPPSTTTITTTTPDPPFFPSFPSTTTTTTETPSNFVERKTDGTASTAAATATGSPCFVCPFQEEVFEVKLGKVTGPHTQDTVEDIVPKVTVKPIPASTSVPTPALHTWGLHVYHKGLTTRDMGQFLIHLKEEGRQEGVEVAGPVQLRFPACQDPMEEMQQLAHTYPGLQMVMAVLNDRVMYGWVRLVGELCLGVVTQCVPPTAVLQPSAPTLRPLIQHIRAKLGGAHLRLPRITTLPHVAPSLLVMALHRATPRARGVPAVMAVVALGSLPAGQYLTEVYAQDNDDDDDSCLEDVICRILQALTHQYRRPVPEQVVVYRDGEGQKEQRARRDVATLTTACTRFMGSYRPEITCVFVCGSPVSWFVAEDMEGPVTPCCVAEQRATQLSDTSFSISVSSDGQSWQPAVYSIVGDGMPIGALQQLTLALCHLPGTPTALQPLPTPVTCARLAVLRCHQHIRTLHDNWRQRKYRDLQRDINSLVTVDTFNCIAHQLYYL